MLVFNLWLNPMQIKSSDPFLYIILVTSDYCILLSSFSYLQA